MNSALPLSTQLINLFAAVVLLLAFAMLRSGACCRSSTCSPCRG